MKNDTDPLFQRIDTNAYSKLELETMISKLQDKVKELNEEIERLTSENSGLNEQLTRLKNQQVKAQPVNQTLDPKYPWD